MTLRALIVSCFSNIISILVSVLVLGMLVSISCAPKVDSDAIAKELTQLDDNWSKAAGTKDAEMVASYYAADAVVYPPNASVVHGQASAKMVWASLFADSTFTLSWKTEQARVAKSGELGFTSGTYQDSYRKPDGTLVTDKGKYLCTWEKQADGTWKATHDMWNSDSM